MKKTGTQAKVLEIPEPNIKLMRLTVVGDSPLICHKFSEKSQRMILDKQTKTPKGPKEAKNPEEDFRNSLYPIPGKPGKFGFPATGFKNAAVDACSFIEGVTKVLSRGAFQIFGVDDRDLVTIESKDGPVMRQDFVRLQAIGNPADIRFRGEFTNWKANLIVRYLASAISPGQIVNLLNTGGFSIGVGERRPQKEGASFGLFHVEGEIHEMKEARA